MNKQIEEMAVEFVKINCNPKGCYGCNLCDEYGYLELNCEDYLHYRTMAETFYNAGYRKQSEGCSFCGTNLYIKSVQHAMPILAPITRADELRHELLNLTGEIYLPIEARFCPLCGAKMKGGAE